MVAKPAAVFRPEERGLATPGSQGATTGQAAAPNASDGASLPAPQDNDPALDFTDFDFDRHLRELQVDAEVDPIDADIEQAVMLYADAHDDATRSLLEDAVRVHHYGPGERLWLMLFDLYLLTGQKVAFEALASEYALCFGQCSPSWRNSSQKAVVAKAAGSMLFKGDLSADNDAAFNLMRKAMETNSGLRLDLSKVGAFDAAGCGRLLGVIHKARKAKREIELFGGDHIRKKLESHVSLGSAEGGDYWLMLLEIYQSQGLQESFENLAINYAVTFEISPPSWETQRVALLQATPAPLAPAQDTPLSPETYLAQGDIKASRFADLAAFIEEHDEIVIDCTRLSRIDFISAGALLNVLSSAKRSGKLIIFRKPNHLVAELFAMVGLKAIADIIPANF